ncbi:MAG TPA: TonB-dependent receptor [Saprospiraceae bacterium]|nr:TonB-dependent receptor [Saprospiraceae bacterium]
MSRYNDLRRKPVVHMLRQITSILLLVLIPLIGQSQGCRLVIQGTIVDESTGIPLEYAAVYLQETRQGVAADSLGQFMFQGICPGFYHLQISHIGCENQNLYLRVDRDTSLFIHLHHHAELLNEIAVHGSREDNSTQMANSIARTEIARESNKNLADLLEKIAGVSVIRNGSGISKPVIHGLHGNRITMINNGLVQAGQQWGNDHAPEIDPFLTDHLTVVKGVSTLAYGGNGLGGVVLAESNPIEADPHLHGQLNYIFQSNGRGHTVNARLQQNRPWAAWMLSGTFKRQGDQRAPDYFLTNTGKKENNLGIQFEKKFGSRWASRLYYSLFDTEIGILRGSHIGNLSDLEEAITRPVPFYTRDAFSYGIGSPRQAVVHHLLKLENKWLINEKNILSIHYGGQINQRREFDVRRSGRSDLPALSLRQYSHFVEGIYHVTPRPGVLIKSGLQYQYAYNTNQPGTGVLPLIPDYQALTGSAFGIYQRSFEKGQWEMGVRYDLRHLAAATISRELPRRIVRFNNNFNNINVSFGGKYQLNEVLSLTTNLGYVLRSPEVNELYSFGLHQGVSGLEEGNPRLKQEKSFKWIVGLDGAVNHKFFIQALGYLQPIWDYIYLQPLNEFRLTIRGAFPVYQYMQTHALLYGSDLLVSYEWNKSVKWTSRASLVIGQDQSRGLPLVYMPAQSLQSDLTYSFGDRKRWSGTYLGAHGKFVFRQNRLEPGQDFLLPPYGYSLFSLEGGSSYAVGKSRLKFSLLVDNLFNTPYRDYLNRLRYYADETGFNASFRLNYSF